jgi:hypothetical protein
MGIQETTIIKPATRHQHIQITYTPNVVDGNSSGLVTPELQARLELLESLRPQISHFKFLNNAEAYYYLLTSCSHILINPTPGNINIEVNVSNVIRHLLSRITCKGDRGDTGDTGDDGRDGVPHNGLEPIFIPIADGDNLRLEAQIIQPLDTPVSLRLYVDGVLTAEVDAIGNN